MDECQFSEGLESVRDDAPPKSGPWRWGGGAEQGFGDSASPAAPS